MNRKLWGPVIVVVGLMAGISFATGSRGEIEKLLASATPLLLGAERLLASLSWEAVAAIAGGIPLLLIGGLLVKRRRAREDRAGYAEPWRTVIQMGKQGRSAATIARAIGLPQDAVRIVLAPVAVDSSLPRGNSFRSSQPGRSGSPRNSTSSQDN